MCAPKSGRGRCVRTTQKTVASHASAIINFWKSLFYKIRLNFYEIIARLCHRYKSEFKINQKTILPSLLNLYSVVCAKLCSKSVVMLWNINQTFQSAHGGAVPYVKTHHATVSNLCDDHPPHKVLMINTKNDKKFIRSCKKGGILYTQCLPKPL